MKSLHRTKATTRMIHDLLRAIVKAGGAARCFTPKKLDEMSALDLIKGLSTNHITFALRKDIKS